MSKKRRTHAKAPGWIPVHRGPVNPAMIQALKDHGAYDDDCVYEAWANDRYDVLVRRRPDGMVHLSIKRRDRSPVRDWRHLQQLKNEIIGPELSAVEIFPPESRLVDSANEYHLWHVPGVEFSTFQDRSVMTPEENQEAQRAAGMPMKGRQRAWEPGLTTGQEVEA